MKSSILVALCLWSSVLALPAEKMQFGNAPKDAAAQAFGVRVADIHRTGGIAAATKFLDAEAPVFLKNASATACYDFFAALQDEAMGPQGIGNKDAAWKQALTRWCYYYCRNEGHSYWYQRWVPMMHEICFDAGNYGEARAVIDYERRRRIEKGIDLDVASLSSTGPANAGFSSVLKRKLGPKNSILTKDYRFILAQAGQEIVEGKWRSGMEVAALGADSAMGNFKWYQPRRNLTDSLLVMTDLTGHWRTAMTHTAEGYRFLDLPWLELETLRELTKFNLDEGRGLFEVRMAEARALHLDFQLAAKDAAAVTKGMEEIRQIFLSELYNAPVHADRVSLMLADVYFRDGKAERGWEILNPLRTNKAHSRDMRFEVDREWCRHRVDAGLTEGVESELVALLTISREGGLKRREIDLYQIYARLLTALGRYQDALVIQREYLRLLKSFDVFTRIPSALHELATLHAFMGQRERAEADLAEAERLSESPKIPNVAKARLREIIARPLPGVAPGIPKTAAVADLQPQRSMMVPLEGLSARGLFTLSNPSGAPISGTLRLQGKGLAFTTAALPVVGIDVATVGGSDTLSRPLTVPAGEFMFIDLSSAPQSANTQVSIVWAPAVGESQSAEWTTDQPESGVSLAITDAAEYLNNPFYMIPFYHLIQYRDTFARAVDVRVVASAPARIEFYDSEDELVCVDADGDGAFTSPGDIISKDLNRNGWGDLVLDPEGKEMRFRMLVHPAKIVPSGDLNLDLQIFDQGKWNTHATDRLVFPKNVR